MKPVASVTALEFNPATTASTPVSSWDTVATIHRFCSDGTFAEGNGWTEWSSSKNAWKNYTARRQLLREPWRSATRGDGGKPDTLYWWITKARNIELDTAAVLTKAYRGDDLMVTVNVTDVSTIVRVTPLL